MPDNNSPITDDASSSAPQPITGQNQFNDLPSGPTATPAQISSSPSMPNNMDSSMPTPDIYPEIARRISEAKNVLIALSSDPSVDEMATAIGLSIYLDKLGKRATAIYSGDTPNALEFLKPERTFEPTADTLQDFVIALSKDKADHLRYKLDGNYVKIYITPYRSRISEDDLDFSYGDYNVDLVLALDVANGIDLDSALREHGRIMHDAVIINITNNDPGKFGEIEWSDKKASSIAEMIAKLLYSVKSEVKIGKEEATAFLTGIVASTNRFSKANTTPETMEVASLLMGSGANQQLISRNITPDFNNGPVSLNDERDNESQDDSSELNVSHNSGLFFSSEIAEKRDNTSKNSSESSPEDILGKTKDSAPENEPKNQPEAPQEDLSVEKNENADDAENAKQNSNEKESSQSDDDNDNLLLDDLKVAAESLSHTGTETTPETTEEPFKIDSDDAEPPAIAEAELRAPVAESEESYDTSTKSVTEQEIANPIAANVPNVPTQPEINGVPDISYMPMPEDGILPPPPTPPIDSIAPTPLAPLSEPSDSPTFSKNAVDASMAAQSTGSIDQVLPQVGPIDSAVSPNTPVDSVTTPSSSTTPSSLGSQPAMQDQVYVPQAADPSAFKIPGI